MKRTLMDLWNGRLEPCGQQEERAEEIAALVRYLERHYIRLGEGPDDDGKETLEKFRECYGELGSIEREEAFVKGMSLGIRIVAEAFSDR